MPRSYPRAGAGGPVGRERSRNHPVIGVVVAALLVPQPLGYATVTGVPVQVGLHAVPLALFAFGVLGSSPQLIVGPASTVAIAASLLSIVYRSVSPRMEVFGKIDDEKAAWRRLRQHPDRRPSGRGRRGPARHTIVLGERIRNRRSVARRGRRMARHQSARSRPRGIDSARHDQCRRPHAPGGRTERTPCRSERRRRPDRWRSRGAALARGRNYDPEDPIGKMYFNLLANIRVSSNVKSDSAAADPAEPKPSLIRPFTGRARQRLRRDGQRLLRGRADLRARTRPVAQRRRTRTRDAVVGVLVQRRPRYHSHCHDVRPTSSKQRFMAQLTASTGVGNQ